MAIDTPKQIIFEYQTQSPFSDKVAKFQVTLPLTLNQYVAHPRSIIAASCLISGGMFYLTFNRLRYLSHLAQAVEPHNGLYYVTYIFQACLALAAFCFAVYVIIAARKSLTSPKKAPIPVVFIDEGGFRDVRVTLEAIPWADVVFYESLTAGRGSGTLGLRLYLRHPIAKLKSKREVPPGVLGTNLDLQHGLPADQMYLMTGMLDTASLPGKSVLMLIKALIQKHGGRHKEWYD